MSEYPAPRYPKLKRPKSVEEIMPKARELLNQPTDREPMLNFMSLKPDYGIKAGDRVLFVALSEYDSMGIEAVCRAIREKGARVDIITLDSTPLSPAQDLAAHEAIAIDEEEGDFSYYYTGICNLLRPDTGRALVELEKYDLIIGGLAGPKVETRVPWHKFNFVSLEDFVGPLYDIPLDLVALINRKGWSQIMSCEVLRMTDPEGTDVSWTNYKDGRPYMENHLPARPMYIGYRNGGRDDAHGVIAGTLNHMGAFPHCRAVIEGGQVVRVEGGGKYGDLWREKLEKYRKVKFPPMPSPSPDNSWIAGEPKYELKDPGFFWFMECAIGTIPGAFRLQREGLFQCFASFIHDRWRTGYVHNGFGAFATAQKEMIEAGLPWIHTHIHSIFATLVGKNTKGEPVVIIDKGHLTALDDDEVRSLAAEYGDPDELLAEAWFPAMPGINAPGDYMEDYARDPVSWIKKEALEHPVWID
ncbi:MAG: hypothetical protein ABII06_11120 [Pseudomonadota bacterium]